MPNFANSLELRAAPPFDLTQVVRSHGWSALAPFRWDEPSKTLSTACELESRVVTISVRETDPHTVVARWTGLAAESSVTGVVDRMLACRKTSPHFSENAGGGRDFATSRRTGLGGCCVRPRSGKTR